MIVSTVDFAALLLAALTVGAMFAVWLIFNPYGLDAATYISQHKLGVRTLNVKMPVLGALTILLIVTAAVLVRTDQLRLTLLLISALFFAAAGLVTRFLNQPINAVVMTWSAEAPPQTWMRLRDAWWRWHLVRFTAGLAGLCLLILATLQSGA